MLLTDEEKEMLDGGQGEIKQKCMQFLVAYGEAAGAERLVDLDGTVDLHPGTFWVRDYVITQEEIEALASRGEKFKVPTFANKATAPGFHLRRVGGLRHHARQRSGIPQEVPGALQILDPDGHDPYLLVQQLPCRLIPACGRPALRVGRELRHPLGQRGAGGEEQLRRLFPDSLPGQGACLRHAPG